MMIRFFFAILAALILLSMAGYAVKLWLKVHKQQQQREQAQQARYQQVLESVEIIAKAMETDQCGLSEGVLRLKPLLDVLGKKLAHYPAMWALYDVVELMPILDDRKALKRNERMKLDLEREAKESELETQIKQELARLLSEIPQWRQQI